MTVLKDIFTDITSIETLLVAHQRALKGKRQNQYATNFQYSLMTNLINLQTELRDGTYSPSIYRHKTVLEPKVRLIEAPSYRDRVVHHAIHNYLSPFYEKHFINDSFACRPGRGIHKAAAKVQNNLGLYCQFLYVCKIDISKYYASINHNRLQQMLSSKIKDDKLLQLLDIIIESTDSGTVHDYLFSSDSNYHTKGRRGIPIGNLTSQLFANIYLHELDKFVKQTLKIRNYVRYMDDILFFHHDKKQLQIWKDYIQDFLYNNLYLTINPRKIRIYPARHGVDFVGFIIFPKYMRLRSTSVKRFKKRYNKQLESLATRRIEIIEMQTSFASWKAHASHANARQLTKNLESKQWAYIQAHNVKKQNNCSCQTNIRLTQLSLFDEK